MQAILCFLLTTQQMTNKPPLPLGQLTHYHKKAPPLPPPMAPYRLPHLRPYLPSLFSHCAMLIS